MATYCRITGKSRGLPKPHYFPLLPPISPADAKRLCRITGKSYGLPTHHYIPVLTVIKRTKKSCTITTNSDGQDHHHFQPTSVKHTVLKGFRYLIPVLDTNAELLQILENKKVNENGHKYIYTVDERRCTLVFPGQLEAAVRDGDVRDIMLAKHSDKLLLKLRKGENIELDMKDFCVDGFQLYEGEGPSSEVLKRKKRKPRENNDWRRKIFEDKEKQAESEEERMCEIKSKRIKVKLDALNSVVASWKSIRAEPADLRPDQLEAQIVNAILGSPAKAKLGCYVNVAGAPIVSSLPQPIKVESCNVDLSHSLPGIIQQPLTIGETVVGFPVARTAAPFQPFVAEPDPQVENVLKQFNADKAALQAILDRQTLVQLKQAGMLVSLEQIPATVAGIRKLLEKGTYAKHKFQQGVKVLVDNVEKYVPGQFVQLESGEVFVPGNVIETSTGISFVPGFALHTEDGPKFLPGAILADEGSSFFVAGQTALTRDGEKFVQGQMVCTADGARFMPGQTIVTTEGVRFVPGQIVQNEKFENGYRFLPGQIVMTPEGPQFVTGQFSQDPVTGESTFVAGQSVLNENCNWEFVPGHSVKTDDGFVFVAGKEMVDDTGRQQFVPGQVVIEDDVERFVPGIVVSDENGGLRFVPGLEVNTADGVKFVEGMITEVDNVFSFAAGKAAMTDKDTIEFQRAETVDDLLFHDAHSAATALDRDDGTEVFGHLVQSDQGVEFFPGDVAGLPAGKVIPGRLVKGKEMRFIPGTMIEGKFTPGQFVTTETEEKFIPGQVIETNDGPKFVPGQVLQTRSGPKFVPGQTMETENGPKFIPGQIIETKRGPAFIPGQVIFTEEEGSRFVPGQVVDTVEGPRFVPGRVVETGDHVTFIPGQIVETEEGLKFIAPDLEDDPEGGYHFTMQGFEVTQEELKMMGNSIPHACFIGEMAIDSRTLQQLAEAGMAVGRQLPVDMPSVDIRSLPVTETACRIADNLDIDASYSVKMSQILSNLQQIKQANVAVWSDDIEDENLKMLLYVTLEGDCDESVEFLHMLGDALEDTIKVDLEHKLQTINTLHASTVDLASKVRERALLVNEIAGQVASKMNVDSAGSVKMAQILSNLQQIKHSDLFVPRKEIKDKNLKMLLNLASNCDGHAEDAELLQALAVALESTISVEPRQKLQTIDTLLALTGELASKARACDQPVMGNAYAIAGNLEVDPSNAIKVSHILSNLQEMKNANVVFPEVSDENLQVLLSLTCKDGDLNDLAAALESTINLNPDRKLDTINTLHALTSTLAAKVEEKQQLVSETASKVAHQLNVDQSQCGKLSQILTNLQQISQSHQSNVPTSVEEEDLKNLIQVALKCDGKTDEEVAKSLATALESAINNAENKPLKIDAILASTSAVATELRDRSKVTTESAFVIANDLKLNPSYVMKMTDILSNLQQIKKMGVPLEDVNNENLELLLNLASVCNVDGDTTQAMKTFADALQSTIKVDLDKKLLTVDTLHALTVDLAAKAQRKSALVDQTALDVTERVNVDKAESVKLGQILTNLQQLQQSNVSLANECIEDENVKKLLNLALQNDAKDANFLQTVSAALEKAINNDPEHKLDTINALQQLTENLVSKVNDRTQCAAESACAVANDLKLDTPHLVKMSRILSNLQQIKESNVAVPAEVAGNENLELLLSLALASDGKDSAGTMKMLAEVLEKTITIDSEQTPHTIDTLHHMTAELASQVRQKSQMVKQAASKVAKKLGVDEAHSIKLGQILSNLQQMKLSNAEVPVESIQDENLKGLINLALECDGKKEATFFQKVSAALEKTLGADPQSVIQNIDSMQTLTADLASDVRNRSKLTAETACAVAGELNVSTPHLIKMSHILSDLHQIRQSPVAITSDGKNENLELLLNLALACDGTATDSEMMKTLAQVLEKTVNADPTQTLETIDALHKLTANVASKARDKSRVVKKTVSEIASKLDLDKPQSAKLLQIFADIQQIKLAGTDIQEGTQDENLKAVLAAALGCDKDAQLLPAVGAAIEQLIKLDPEHKSQNLDSLHSVTSDLASKIRNRSLLTTEASLVVANDLNVTTPHLVKMGHILSNLRQIKRSNFAVSDRDLADSDVELLLNLALACDPETEDPDIIATLADALQRTIKVHADDIPRTIDSLHASTSKLASKALEKSRLLEKAARNVASKLDVGEAHSIKLGQILSNLQQLNSSKVNVAKQSIANEAFKTLIDAALKYDGDDAKFAQAASAALETALKADLEHKLLNIDSLLTLTRDLVSKARHTSLLTAETACAVASELDVSTPHLVKIGHILASLQQIERSDLAVVGKAMPETLELLMNLALACKGQNDGEAIQTFADALQRTIKFDPDAKLNTIDSLHTLTGDLASKARDKTRLVEESADHVATALGLDSAQAAKVGQILSSLQRVKLSNADVSKENIKDKTVKKLLNAALDCNAKDDAEYLTAVAAIIENTLKTNPEKCDSIDLLHEVATKLAVKSRDRSLLTTETAAEVANELNLSTPQLMKMSHILSDLQQIKQSNVGISQQDIPNENLQLLLNLALGGDHEQDAEVIKSLADALHKTVEVDSDSKVNTIDTLHQLTSNLASESRQKSKLIEKIAGKVANKLRVDNGHTVKLGQILSNLQQMKLSNVDISKEEIGSKTLRKLIKVALDCDGTDAQLLTAIASVVENTINEDPTHKVQNIDSLHALTIELAARTRDQARLAAETAFVISNGQMSTPRLVKISRILSNLHKIKRSGLAVGQDVPENLELLLDLAAACSDKQEDAEAVQTLASALQKTLNVNADNKFQTIDQLHDLTVDLATKAHEKSNLFEKSACQIANELNVDDQHAVKLNHILSNLQKVADADFDSDDIKDETLKLLVETAARCNGTDSEFLKTVGVALENAIKADPEHLTQNIDSLHALAADLATKASDKSLLIIEKAYEVAGDLNANTPQLIQMSHILSNLRQMQRSDVAIPDVQQPSESLELLLNLSLACSGETTDGAAIQILADSLKKTVKVDSDGKADTIKTLHQLTLDLATKAQQKSRAVAKVAGEIATKFDISDAEATKLSRILSDVERIKQSKLDVSREDVNENLRPFLTAMLECGETDQLHALGAIMETMIEGDAERKIRNIDSMHALTSNLASKIHARSLLTTETAYAVANDLQLDTPHLVKLGHVISNLQQIKQSYGAIAIDDIEDEKLKLLLNLALSCDPAKKDGDVIKVLADVLENSINVEPEQKLQTIDTLHALTAELASTMTQKSKNIHTTALKIAQNLNVGEAYSHKLGEILSNLQQMKASRVDIDKEEIPNESWKQLINLAMHAKSEDPEATESLGVALEKLIRSEPDRKLQNINSLHAFTRRIVSKVNEKALLVSQTAFNIANDLNVNTAQLLKMSRILSNLQQVKVTQIVPEIADEKLQVLMNLAMACEGDDSVAMNTFAAALANTINVNATEKLSTIDSLHTLTADLAAKAAEKSDLVNQAAQQVAQNLDVDATRTVKLQQILANVQQIKSSDVTYSTDDVKRLVKCVQEHDSGQGDAKLLQQLGGIVEDIVTKNPERKLENIDSLHSAVTEIAAKVRNRSQLLTENAMQVANHLGLDTSQLIKMSDVLSNIQRVKELGVATSEVQDPNLKLLLSLAECDGREVRDDHYMGKLKDALENTIKVDLQHKQQTVHTLHALAVDLAAKAAEKSVRVDKMARKLAHKCDVDQSHAAKLGHILCNLQRIAGSNVPVALERVEDESLKALLLVALECEDDELQTLAGALEKSIKAEPQHKLQNIDKLHRLTAELAASQSSNSFAASEAAYAAASDLNVNASQVMEMSDILLNLQRLRQSNVVVPTGDITDENVKLLINLAQVCDADPTSADFLRTLGVALEKTLKLHPALKSQTIQTLRAVAVNLATKAGETSALIAKTVDKVTSHLNLNKASAVKISSVLANLLQIKQTDIEVPYEQVDDKNLKKLLSLALDCESDTDDEDFLQTLGDAIESIIKLDPEHKTQIVDTLHASTTSIFSKVNNKSLLAAETVCRVVSGLSVDPSHAIHVNQILSNLKQLKQSQAFIANEDIQDENLKVLLNLTLLNDNDVDSPEFMHALADAIGNTIRVDTEHKAEAIDSMHSLTADLVSAVRDKSKLVDNITSKMANKVKVDASKLRLILSNLEQIKHSNLDISSAGIKDKNLKALMSLASECDNNLFLEKVSDCLEKIIKTNPQHKLQVVNTLCALTSDLASEARDKSLLVAETATNIANKMNVNASAVNVSHILSNLQKIKRSNAAVSSHDVQDEDLKRLVDLALAYEGDVESTEFLRTLGQALSNTTKIHPELVAQTVEKFHVLTDQLAAEIHDRSELIEETATRVAKDLKVDKSAINVILSNLQQMKSSNVIPENIQNEDVKVLLNLALQSGLNLESAEFFKVLGDAIEDIIKVDLEHKTQKVETLHALTSDLSAKARAESLLATRAACKVADRLNVDSSHSVNISHILSNLQQIKELGSAISIADVSDDNLRTLLQKTLALDDKDDTELLAELGDILEKVVSKDPEHKLQTIGTLHSLTANLVTEVRDKPPNKIQLLKNLIQNNFELEEDVVKKLSSILDENEMAVCVAFQHMSRENPDFVNKVLQNASDILKDKSGDEKKAVDTLHRAIVQAVAETSEQKVNQTLRKTRGEEFRSLVVDAVGLAKALGMSEVVSMLNDILKDANSMPILARDKVVMEVLKRLTVMRQLAAKQPSFRSALRDLQFDPYAARNDPRLRELVRESAMLMVIPEESLVLRSSADIPSSLLLGDNTLAVEDFMVKSRQTGRTFLILKRGVQMVLPREAARDVLTGKVPYTVLDENGIQHFTPLHVFNALKLPRIATNRFSNYGYSPRVIKPKGEDSRDLFSRCGSISFDDLRKSLPNGSCSTQEMEEEFILIKDFVGDDHEFFVNKGDRVKVLEADDDDPTFDKSSKKLSCDSRRDLLPTTLV